MGLVVPKVYSELDLQDASAQISHNGLDHPEGPLPKLGAIWQTLMENFSRSGWFTSLWNNSSSDRLHWIFPSNIWTKNKSTDFFLSNSRSWTRQRNIVKPCIFIKLSSQCSVRITNIELRIYNWNKTKWLNKQWEHTRTKSGLKNCSSFSSRVWMNQLGVYLCLSLLLFKYRISACISC